MDPHEFLPMTARELWKIADRSVREYQYATAALAKGATAVAPPASRRQAKKWHHLARCAAHRRAPGSCRDRKGGEEAHGMGASIVGWLVDAIETLVATTAMKLVNWFSELITKWFVFAIPAVAALGDRFDVCDLAGGGADGIDPRGERSIGEFLYYVVFD